MRIGYIIGTYPLVTTTFIDREIEGVRARGIEIDVLSLRRPPAEVARLAEYQTVYQTTTYLLPPNWVQFLLAHLFYTLGHPVVYWSLFAYLISRPHRTLQQRFKTLLHFGEGVYAAFLLRNRVLDHLHAHFVDRAATVALVAGRLLDKPYSVTGHANDLYADPLLLFEKFQNARFAITVSQFNKEYILTNEPYLDPERIFVLHPWVDLDEFKVPSIRNRRRRFSILSVGRLVEKKGHAFLIEACQQLRAEGIKAECRIVGAGPLEDELQGIIQAHGLADSVHLLGAKSKAEVMALLSEADVFVLASVIAANGDRDGMPVALAEAMAMQVPVISTDIVGMRELVQLGAGLLVAPRDPFQLARAIRTIYEMAAEDRASMGELARSVIRVGFDVNSGIDQLVKLFRQSAARSHPTRVPEFKSDLQSQERFR